MKLLNSDMHRERARTFAVEHVAPSVAARDREARWEGELFRHLGAAGFLAPGLLAGGKIAGCELSELLNGFAEGSADAGLSLAWGAHTAGCLVPLARLGSDAQHKRWLLALSTGQAVGAWAHLEPPPDREDAVTPTGVGTRAVRRGSHFVLEGKKTWVVNGGIADLLIVTATTEATKGQHGVSTFLVPRETPGLVMKRRLDTLGMRTTVLSEVELRGCELDAGHLLGAEGTGLTGTFRLVQRWERVALFAPWIGLLRLVLDSIITQARAAARLGRPLALSQLGRATLADMKIRLELGIRLVARAAWQLDRGPQAGDLDIAVSQLFVAQSVQQILREALAVQGLPGLGSEQLSARLQRDAAAICLLGGGQELLRSVIAGSLLGLG